MAQLREPVRDDRPFAVVDVGSNSARMIVFRIGRGGHLDVLEDARAPLRLARELRDDDELGPEAIERTLEALRDFVAVAEAASARRFLAVATSAVREARDRTVLIDRAREIGITIEVIDGDTEARLGFVGAVHDLPIVDGATMDVGGGTTEVTRFRDRRIERSWTLPLGSLRLMDRFLTSDPPSHRQLAAVRSEIDAAFRGTGAERLAGGDLVGIGGTIRNLAKIDRRRTGHPLPLLHAYELPRERLDPIVHELAARPAKQRAKTRGLNPDRVDSIVAGGLIVSAAMRHLGVERLIVSSRGLREGIALGGSSADMPDPAWVRTISIATLAARFASWDPRAADRRESLAAALLREVAPGAAPVIREMLSQAAIVVDVGRAIDYYERFSHAAAIVTAADLGGFDHEALGVLTAILLQADDDDVALGPIARLVPKELRRPIRRAATALALADELNRRIAKGKAVPFSCAWRGRIFEVRAPVVAGWRPAAVARRFNAVFGASLSVVPVAQAARMPTLEPD